MRPLRKYKRRAEFEISFLAARNSPRIGTDEIPAYFISKNLCVEFCDIAGKMAQNFGATSVTGSSLSGLSTSGHRGAGDILRDTIFGMLHLVSEQRSASKRSRQFSMILMLLDFYSLAALIVRQEFGWPISSIALNWVDGILSRIIALEKDTNFLIVWSIVQIIVWFNFINAVFVAWSFTAGNFKQTPALILRWVPMPQACARA